MELSKKTIHTSSIKPGVTLQMTLDDDFNVPDSKPDVEKITTTRGEVEIVETEALTDKIRISGNCHFYVLYATNLDSYPVCALDGMLPFEQTLNCDGLKPNDNVKAKAILEDLSISIINSRKLNIRCLISLKASVLENQTVEAAIDAETPFTDSCNSNNPQCYYKTLDMTSLAVNKKDIFRIKEEITLPQGKPPIYEILWSSATLSGEEARVGDGVINLSGELALFILYNSDAETAPLRYLEMNLPFNGELPCEDCREGMPPCIDIRIATTNFAIKPDNEGEERLLDVECTLELDIRIYEEEQLKLLADLYSPVADCRITSEPLHITRLLQKNSAKTRISQRLKLKDAKESILQICHIDGAVKIDDMIPVADGVNVEGLVTADILYFSGSDSTPLSSTSLMVPFRYLVELEGLTKNDTYEISANLDQITLHMVDSNEVELKAIISLSAIAFENQKIDTIKEVDITPLDAEKMQRMPGMVGYIVKPDDTLWSIAKTYYTTVDLIKSCNQLENEAINAGDKLIIMKGCE